MGTLPPSVQRFSIVLQGGGRRGRRPAKISLLIAPSFAVPRWQKRIPVPPSPLRGGTHTYDVRSGKLEKGWKLCIYVGDNKGEGS